MRRISFAKGHGTENDFVIIPDLDGELALTAEQVRAICDRHAGIGADGILRVVRSGHVPEWEGAPDLWFMDYRNADGSIAEMCGNGVRVFAHYLIENDLDTGPLINIATRAGLRPTQVLADGRYRVGMGPVVVDPEVVRVSAAGLEAELAAFPADVGNPHAVAFVDDLESLELHRAPRWSPQDRFPNGVNVEFVRRIGPLRVAMRVYERGSGETRSCGTGTVAVAAVAAMDAGQTDRPVTYRVDVPGGTVEVELNDQQSFLTGPAEIVATGELLFLH
ncbi:MAG TPA: diaminopimelate epimerase [Microlunatus sp.]